MSLVHGEQADAPDHLFHALDKAFVVQSLWRTEEDPELAVAESDPDFLLLIPRLGGVHGIRRNAAPHQTVDLVFHEGNQRRDDYSKSVLSGAPGVGPNIHFCEGYSGDLGRMWVSKNGTISKPRLTLSRESLPGNTATFQRR